jgi:hypothetical protein
MSGSEEDSVAMKLQPLALLALLAVTALTACINYYYTPGIYEIAEGRVGPFSNIVALEIESSQEPDPDRKFVFYKQGGAKWRTDRAMIAQAIADQIATEIVRSVIEILNDPEVHAWLEGQTI